MPIDVFKEFTDFIKGEGRPFWLKQKSHFLGFSRGSMEVAEYLVLEAFKEGVKTNVAPSDLESNHEAIGYTDGYTAGYEEGYSQSRIDLGVLF